MATRDKSLDADRRRDEAVDESFTASDPPAHSGIVGPGGHPPGKDDRQPPHQRDENSRPKGKPTSDRHATETAYVWEDEERPPAP